MNVSDSVGEILDRLITEVLTIYQDMFQGTDTDDMDAMAKVTEDELCERLRSIGVSEAEIKTIEEWIASVGVFPAAIEIYKVLIEVCQRLGLGQREETWILQDARQQILNSLRYFSEQIADLTPEEVTERINKFNYTLYWLHPPNEIMKEGFFKGARVIGPFKTMED